MDTFLAGSSRTRARLVAGSALIFAALSVGTAGIADAQSCRGAHSTTAPVKATLCLVNVERRARGLATLTPNAGLVRAARRHAADMVFRGYFSHTSPSGVSFTTRLMRSGYIRSTCSWWAGETLAWGIGAAATPAGAVSAWMHSPPHRVVLLGRAYREAGIAAVGGVPSNRGAGVTYAAEFGRRRC